MSYYPPVDLTTVKNLSVIKKLASEQPDYFKDSPYPREVEDFLGTTPKPVVEGDKKNGDDEELDVLKEVQATYRELQNHIPAKDDSAATMSYFRTRASLLDKLLEQMERGKNQKQISEFYDKVLSILEEVCTPTQRTVFEEQLKEFSK